MRINAVMFFVYHSNNTALRPSRSGFTQTTLSHQQYFLRLGQIQSDRQTR